MITFTLTVVISLLGLIGLAIGYWLGYRTGYTDGVEDASGTVDEWKPLSEGSGPYGLPKGAMVGGYSESDIRHGLMAEAQWPKDEHPAHSGRDHTP
jgi:hypothetical protein